MRQQEVVHADPVLVDIVASLLHLGDSWNRNPPCTSSLTIKITCL